MKSYEKNNYSWCENFSLSSVAEEVVAQYARKRAKQIIKQVKMQAFSSFEDGFEHMPSCGLFCGK